MPLLLRSIRSGKRQALLSQLPSIAKQELEKALDKEVKPALVKSLNLVVANWEHKPKFQARKTIGKDKITLTVFPVGENADIFKFVDQGTKPHVIKPVRAKMLRFQLGYKSKTLARPARTVSGGGVATGDVVVAKRVNHPGNEARNFTGTIAEDIKPGFNRTIDNTFRKISRMMEE